MGKLHHLISSANKGCWLKKIILWRPSVVFHKCCESHWSCFADTSLPLELKPIIVHQVSCNMDPQSPNLVHWLFWREMVDITVNSPQAVSLPPMPWVMKNVRPGCWGWDCTLLLWLGLVLVFVEPIIRAFTSRNSLAILGGTVENPKHYSEDC